MKKNEQKQNRKRLNSQSAPQKLPPLNKKQTYNDKPCLLQISHQDEGIVGLLYEYLLKNNFLDTLDSFQKDCRQKGFKPNNKYIQSFKHEIIQAFDNGNRDIFMARFGQYVPISMRNKDLQIMKLQFYFQVYFFVYSFHPQLGKKRTVDVASKQALVQYLQGRGATLTKLTQLLPYFALVYLQKPQEHPSFKTLFTKQWISQLKKQLIYLVQKLYPAGKQPVLINIYDKFIQKNLQKNNSQQSLTEPDDELEIQEHIQPQQSQLLQINDNGGNQQSSRAQQTVPRYQSLRSPNAFQATDRQKESLALKIAELEEKKNQLMSVLETAKKRYQLLQINYKDFTDAAQNTLMQSQTKWFKITQQFYNMASSLKDACVKLQSNIPLDDPTVVDKIGKKLSKYESFVKMNIEDLISENVDFSLFERPENDLSVDMVRRNNDARMQYLIPLDFDKVKAILSSPSKDLDYEKCYLLEALKWRLTKTRGALYKRQVVLSFVLNDILNLKKGDDILKRFLYESQNETVLMKFLQFLNAFTKDYYGRKYLCCQAVVKNAMDLLKKDNMQQSIIVIIVSFLQQMSVRKDAQQMMIEGDMIKWIVTKLKNQRQTMSEYLMQYSLATIINLLLKKEGLKKSQQIKQQILTTLIDLMQIQVIEIRQYVHGAIYPLFYKKVFRQKAKQYGLQANIKFLLQHTDSEHIITQLNYLQKQLMREDDEKQEQNDEQEDIDEIFDQQFGEDFDFQTQMDYGEGLSGQELLIKKYSLTGPDAVKQLSIIRQQAETTLKNKSVYVANNTSQRPGTSNKLPLKKNISNNNSVYSNKSSSRILKSQLMNRSQLNKNQGRQKLDTVIPDNSQKQMSIKDFIQDINESNAKNQFPTHKQSRKKESNQFVAEGRSSNQYDNRAILPNVMENDSFNKQKKINPRSGKPYQNNTQYHQAFMARKSLVRTPPQK